jgi:magnesium chelatase subunit I
MLDDDEDLEIVGQFIRAAVLHGFREHVAVEKLGEVIDAFDEGLAVELGALTPTSAYTAFVAEMPALGEAITHVVGTTASPGEVAAAAELVLEGLHLTRRLNKDVINASVIYRSR